MNFFGKSGNPVSDIIFIDLFNEPPFYSSGDRVRGQVLVSYRNWRQVGIEVLIVYEEHAELSLKDAKYPKYKTRRVTVSGETLDGESYEDENVECGGAFPFEMSITDDQYSPVLLPSFEVESEDSQLLNCILWSVEVRVTFKGKEYKESKEIVVVPMKPINVSDQHRTVRQDLKMRAYEPRSKKLLSRSLKKVQKFNPATVIGILSLPEIGLYQSPSTLPLKILLMLNHPHLLVISCIEVQLKTVISTQINDNRSEETITETLFRHSMDISPTSDSIDLSSYLSGITINNVCSSFNGKWLGVCHRIQIQISLESAEKREYKRAMTLETEVIVMPPRLPENEVDAPPHYSPSAVPNTNFLMTALELAS